MKHLPVLILFVFFPWFFFSQKNYPSLLWKVSKDNKTLGYLYGTMHVSNKSAFRFSDAMLNALEQCSVVAMESDPSVWLPSMLKTGMLNTEQTVYSSPASGSFYNSLFSIPFPNNYIYTNVFQFEPDIINGLLFRNVAERKNYQEATYVDLFIYQMARKKNKQILSLEDFESSEIYSRLASLPDEEFDTIPREINQAEQKDLETFYREGNLDAIDSIFRETETRNTCRFLIEERNHFFLHRLDSVLKRGVMVFAAMGAAHLPGSKGIIESLREKGYKVDPIMNTSSEKYIKKVQEIQQQIYRVRLQSYSVFDSTLTMKTSCEFYPLFTYDNISCAVSPDIINGNYVTAIRFKTYGLALNLSRDQLLKKTDSLIYEGIAGKIIYKNVLPVQQDFTGWDIFSRLGDDRVQHTKIFVHPLWIYVIKIQCQESYYKMYGKTIMESVRCVLKKNNTAEFTPPNGYVQLKQMDYTSYFKNIRASSSGIFEVYETFSLSDNKMLGWMRGKYPGIPAPEMDTLELRRLYQNIRNSFFAYDTSGYFRLFLEQGRYRVEFYFYTRHQNFMRGWITKADGFYSLIYLISSSRSSLFSESQQNIYKKVPVSYNYSFEKIRDDDFFFRTFDEVSHSGEDVFNRKYQSVYKKYKHNSPAFIREQNKPLTYQIEEKLYYSPSCMNAINIVLEKYVPYESVTHEEFKKRLLQIYSDNYSCKIRVLKYDTVHYHPFLHVCLVDTGTTEQLHFRIYVKDNRVYQLKYIKDSLDGKDVWMERFIEHFEPLDTLPQKSLFINKFKDLTTDLLSSDTTVSGHAFRILENDLTLSTSQTNSWIDFVRSHDFSQLPTRSKALLILRSSHLASDKIVPELKKMYRQWSDSSYLQLTILKTLALFKNSLAVKCMTELLMEEIPVTGEKSYVENIFIPLLDSLPLTRHLIPALIRLIDVDEYRNVCVSLMALMLENDLIKIQDYASVTDKLLLYGRLELKKYFASGYLNNLHFNAFVRTKNISESSAQFLNDILEEFTVRQDGAGKVNTYLKAFTGREIFLNYFMLLAPYHASKSSVKEYVRKVMKISSYHSYLPMMMWALKHHLISVDSLRKVCSEAHWLNWYIYYLTRQYHLSHSTNTFIKYDEESFMKQMILTTMKTTAGYVYENHPQKDSLKLYRMLPVSFKNRKGKLYIFRSSPDSFGRYAWHYGYVPDSSSGAGTVEGWKVILVNFRVKLFKKDKEMEALLKEDFENLFMVR